MIIPNDILLLIFLYLDWFSLYSIALVNKNFNDIFKKIKGKRLQKIQNIAWNTYTNGSIYLKLTFNYDNIKFSASFFTTKNITEIASAVNDKTIFDIVDKYYDFNFYNGEIKESVGVDESGACYCGVTSDSFDKKCSLLIVDTLFLLIQSWNPNCVLLKKPKKCKEFININKVVVNLLNKIN